MRVAEITRDPKTGVEISAHGTEAPTLERKRHGRFERDEVYEGKQARRVLRAIDNLRALYLDGKITKPEFSAGQRFRTAFEVAGLDPLRAADLGRSGGRGRGVESDRVTAARETVHAMLRQLGGASTPIGLAAWWVVGAGCSYREFARRQRWGRDGWMTHKIAAALTVGALAVWGGDEKD